MNLRVFPYNIVTIEVQQCNYNASPDGSMGHV